MTEKNEDSIEVQEPGMEEAPENLDITEGPVVLENSSEDLVEADMAAEADDSQEEEDDLVILPSMADDEDEFDWDSEDDDGYSKAERAKLESLYESTLKKVAEGEIVSGTVISIGEKEVILNIGFKSEGMVQVSEFRDLPNLKIGDKVDVYLESVEDQNGALILSRKRAKHMRTWQMILRAEEEDVILEGLIKRRTKGGFVTDIGGIEAFLPGSQIDVKPVRDFDAYVGKTMDFKVVKINHPYENVVISHKVLIEKDLEKQRLEILKNLEKGQVLEGTVKNMTNFGVFIDLGGVDGLLHITDISWGRINHPEEVLELDQKLNVVVLEFDQEKKRISLGLKQLQPHPWDSLPETIVEGSRVTGRVVTVADYGIFIEIVPGVEGLVHMSEMSWSQHLKDPAESYRIGDEVEAVVLTIDRDEKKMSLGVKQTKNDPWDQAEAKYAVGTIHKGIVRNMTSYGLFVELEEGIDGLVHISDLSWTKKYNHPSEFINRDEQLEVIVLEIDVPNRRLSLGHKQLTEDVWETFASIFVIDSEHEGTLLRSDDKGAIVELEYGVEGFIPRKHMETAEGESKLKIGSKVKVKVIEFNKDAKKLVLSHRLTWNEEAIEQPQKKAQSGGQTGGGGKKKQPQTPVRAPKAETTLLGEMDALQALRLKMQAAEEASNAAEAPAEAPAAPVAEEAAVDSEDASNEEE